MVLRFDDAMMRAVGAAAIGEITYSPPAQIGAPGAES
jgi:hypothetical protein